MDFLPTPDRSQNNTAIALVDEGLSVSLNDTAAKVGFAVLIPRHQIACWSRRAQLYSRLVSKCSRQEDHHVLSHCACTMDVSRQKAAHIGSLSSDLVSTLLTSFQPQRVHVHCQILYKCLPHLLSYAVVLCQI